MAYKKKETTNSAQTVALCDERHKFLEKQFQEIKTSLDKMEVFLNKIDDLQKTVMGGIIVALLMFIANLVFRKT